MLVRNAAALAVLLSFAPACARAAPSQVHLSWQGPTDTTMTVVWRSTEPTGVVEYGADASYGSTQAARSIAFDGTYLHEAQLTGLSPGQTYHYRCGDGSKVSADRTFTTGPAKSAFATFRFAAYGDSRSDDGARARVRAAVQARSPAFSIDSGDLVDDGWNQSQWNAWFATMEPLLSTSPMAGVSLGNHEGNSTSFFQQFAFPKHQPSASGYNDEAYYSLEYGNTHVVVLNTEQSYGPGSAQHTWLEKDLAAAAADPAIRWKIAVFHRPPYSSGSHGSDTSVRAAFAPLFEKYGVTLAFSGHDHDYERTHPMVGGSVAQTGGVTYVVTGGAGAPLYGVGKSAFTAFSRATYHFMDVSVTPTELVVEARDADGNVFDAVRFQNTTALPADGDGRAVDEGAGAGAGSGGGDDLPGMTQVAGGCGYGGGATWLAGLGAVAALATARRRARR